MVIFIVTAITVTALGFIAYIGLYRRRRRLRPAVYHIVMAQYIWQPRKLK